MDCIANTVMQYFTMDYDHYASLVTKLFPDHTLTKIERLTGGVSADVHRLDLQHTTEGGLSVVMRAHRAGHQGHSAEVEFQLLRSLHKAGLPVPEAILVDTSATLWPEPFLIMSFLTGTTKITDAQQQHSIDAMAQQLIRIHTVSTEILPALPSRLNPLPEVFEFLPEATEWNELRSHLNALTDTEYTDDPCLLHGDFWVENLLWQDDNIVGVLDWEDSALGDPLSDVASASVELRYKFGQAGMQRFLKAYASAKSIDAERLALWQVYVAAAAHRYMGDWGLDPDWEAHMRKEALASIREAANVLMS